MPGIVRKLVVVAAVEGLILQPVGHRNQRSLQIKYSSQEISASAPPTEPDLFASTEIYGIVGLLSVAPISYLIAVLRREQVAQIKGAPIFVVTDVTLIPVSSQVQAKKAIDQANESLRKSGGPVAAQASSDTSDDDESHVMISRGTEDEDVSPVTSESSTNDEYRGARPSGPERSNSNVAEDVIRMKGQYGRFAKQWFSRKGWSTDQRRLQGMSADEAEGPRSARQQDDEPQVHSPEQASVGNALKHSDSVCQDATEENAPQLMQDYGPGIDSPTAANTLLPKLLRTTRLLLVSRGFFFSYDIDITRRLGTSAAKGSELPLNKSADPLYFWNAHLSLPLIRGGHHSFVLPLMQGFVGQKAFTISEKAEKPSLSVIEGELDPEQAKEDRRVLTSETSSYDFLLTLISRRSVKRPGLRYLRRGVDDDGNAANTVETEQILSKASWAKSERICSFTQIRGSIPLFFMQSPIAFKPVPVLQRSAEMNMKAFKRHFSDLTTRYGNVQIVLLVNKKGGEAEIGRKYEENITKLIAGDGSLRHRISFEWFDFHDVCRGMKFENVSLLMESLRRRMEEFGHSVELDNNLQKRQNGASRTSCMDCLDRTNVVQSACGQRALENQLAEMGVKVDLLNDLSIQWFNTLWADNGDAISQQYTNTAALKGDYTRTRRRNYRGAIIDLGLTLSRYYNNIVNDYFAQAAIDFLLGNVTSQIFADFEANLENRDPAMSIAKVRTNAIDICSKIVIADQGEDFIGGWTLLSPRQPDTVRTHPFEETCLLITDAAIYHVRFDWNVEKVSSFERVDLRHIHHVEKGTYITSTLAPTETDPSKNVGFVIKYKPGKEHIMRVNTRSLSSVVVLDRDETEQIGTNQDQKSKKRNTDELKLFAFKALPAQNSFTGQETQTVSEQELVSHICEEIRREVLGADEGTKGFLEDKDIISLQEAKNSTGLIEQWGHSIKRLVWA